MLERIKNASKRQKIIGALIILAILIGVVTAVIKIQSYKTESAGSTLQEEKEEVLEVPSLNLIPSKDINNNNKEEFDVDVTLSSLPPNIYPAASISVSFDKNKLEFTGIKNGTMKTYGNGESSSDGFSVPTWKCDTEASNNSSEINAMYVDMTAGRFAYNKDGFDNKSKNSVIRLGFKLKEGVKVGDILKLDLKDAIFATVNGDKDNTSLSAIKETLKINGCEVAVQ